MAVMWVGLSQRTWQHIVEEILMTVSWSDVVVSVPRPDRGVGQQRGQQGGVSLGPGEGGVSTGLGTEGQTKNCY